jgi:hypothetical protein
MGYTHYWYRKVNEIDQDLFNLIQDDFKKLIPTLEQLGVFLANGIGEGEPIFRPDLVSFNGPSDCGHAKNSEISIPWPSKEASGVVKGFDGNDASGHWFAGALIDKRCCNGDCSYETFHFPRIINDSIVCSGGELFDCCKTAYRPYDLAVNCFLVIAQHRLGGLFRVSTDGDDWNWAEARVLCQQVLGYGADFEIGGE